MLRYRNDLDGSECVENQGNDEPETSGFVIMVEKYCNLSNIDNSNKDTERVATTITLLYSTFQNMITHGKSIINNF